MALPEPEFAALAMEQFDALRGLAARLNRDPERAEDLVQETYLRALRARETFRMEEYGIRPWLMRILHNLHVTRSARESRQPAAMEADALAQIPGHDGQSTVPAGFEDMDEELVWALNALPDAYRVVLLLWALENLSYAEIAHMLSLPAGTVMSRLHRARRLLSKRLQRFAEERRLGSL